MSINNMVGEDTLVINDYPIHPDFAGGDNVTITFPNELVTLETGKNKNTIYAKNETGSNVEITINVMRGSSADKKLSGLLATQERDFIGFELMNGAFTKRVGNGTGKVTYDTYVLRGLVFTKFPEMKANVSGDAEQGKTSYTLRGALAVRGIM